MYIIAWEFIIRAECVAQFEAAYGPQGDWAQLFASAEGYSQTRLLRDTAESLHFVTLDFWRSREAYDEFRQAIGQEYEALDRQCERLTVQENKLGEFETP